MNNSNTSSNNISDNNSINKNNNCRPWVADIVQCVRKYMDGISQNLQSLSRY